MVNNRKFAITDPAFLAKMIEQCRDDEERAWVYILYYTGMHGSLVRTLTPENLFREGDKLSLRWKRTKQNSAIIKTVDAYVPMDKQGLITSFLASKRKKSLRWMNYRLAEMGKKAGFDGVSTMTFRHTLCVKLALDGVPLPVIQQKLGCTAGVIYNAYGLLTPEQLREATRLRQ